jgi:hypothetical protein
VYQQCRFARKIPVPSSSPAIPGETAPELLAHGMSEERRVGSMAAASDTLTITSPNYSNGLYSMFQVGDSIIVEVGGEAGAGQFGTDGVGGTAPVSDVFFYYRSMDTPLALMAEITAISPDGKTITLDTPASVATTNANIYFDNWAIVEALLAEAEGPGHVVTFPAGDFAMSEIVRHNDLPGWTITGAGKHATIFRSPGGTKTSGFWAFQSSQTTFSHFSIVGNLRDHGFGRHHLGNPEFGIGVLCTVCDDCVIDNIATTNIFRKTAWFEFCNDSTISNCDNITDVEVQVYDSQWYFGANDSTNCTVTNCTMNSLYLLPGFETFRSNGVTFLNCTSRNGLWASNSSGNFTFENIVLYIGALSRTGNFTSEFSSMIDINSNIQPPDATTLLGGNIINPHVIIEGYTDFTNNLPISINIGADNPNISITDGLIDYLVDWSAPSALDGPIGVNSTGDNTVVTNLTVTGICQVGGSFKNINVQDGAVTGCTANEINCVGGCVLT